MKLPVFHFVHPLKIDSINESIAQVISADSLEIILKSYLGKINRHEVLEILELRFLIEWGHKLSSFEFKQVTQYVDQSLPHDANILALIDSYFDQLNIPEVVFKLIQIEAVLNKMSVVQLRSFQLFHERTLDDKSDGAQIIEYIENLYFISKAKYSRGQISEASKFIFEADFSDIFENKFFLLESFLSKVGIEFPSSAAQIFDKQLGLLLDKDESHVTAKAFDHKLGYQQYVQFIIKYQKQLNVRLLKNYGRLQALVAKFKEAVDTLSEQEAIRGRFWSQNLKLVDAVILGPSTREYKVSVAFFVGEFVVCDFGPTNNAIHIYSKESFVKYVRNANDWKSASHLLTGKFGDKGRDGRLSHVGDWTTRMEDLLKRMRRDS